MTVSSRRRGTVEGPVEPGGDGGGGSPWARLLRNAASNAGGFVVQMTVTFFLFPFTISRIGDSAYGILVLATTLVGYSGVLSFGLRPTLIKKSAEHLARGDRPALQRVTGQIVALYGGVAFLVLLLTGVGAWLLPSVLNVGAERVPLFRTVLLLVGLQATITLPGSVWTGLVEGLEDYHVAALLRIAGEGIRVVSTVVLLLAGYGLVSLVLAYLGISVLQFVGGWLWVRHRLPWLRLAPAGGTRKDFGELFRFSGAMFLLGFSGSSEEVSDKLVLGTFASPAAVTFYEVGVRLSTYSRQVIVQMITVLLPAASALAAREDRELLRRVMTTGSRAVIFLHGMFFVGLLTFGRDFIQLWMGPGYERSYIVLVLLMIATFAHAHVNVPWAMCRGTGDLNVTTRLAVARMVLNVALSIVLVGRWGIVGVAAATAVAYGLQTAVLVVYFSRLFAVPFATLLGTVYLRTWVPLGVAAGAALAVRSTVFQQTWLHLVAAAAATGAVGAAVFWLIALSGAEKRRLTGAFQARLARAQV